jgi:hypothetical protein
MLNEPSGAPWVEVRLLHVPECPLADRVRDTLRESIADSGLAVRVEDVEGPFPSPTLLVGGVDVVTGGTPATEPCCRLDLPSRAQIRAALQRVAASGAPPRDWRDD